MTRRVYIYDWPAEIDRARLVLPYLTPQHGGEIPKRLCVHDVDAKSGPEAKRMAVREHRARCGWPSPADIR
jgi:hypothetical protein